MVGGVIGIEPVVDRHHPGYAEEELVFEIKRFFVAKVSIRQHTFFFAVASASCGSPDADTRPLLCQYLCLCNSKASKMSTNTGRPTRRLPL